MDDTVMRRTNEASPMPACIWLTGCPSAGKSTLALALAEEIGRRTARAPALIDADIARRTLGLNLGFSDADRRTNIIIMAFAASRVVQAGGSAVVACIAPQREARLEALRLIGPGNTTLVHVDCPLEVREARDPNGLYARARSGEIKGLTGLDAPYDTPTLQDDAEPTANRFVRVRTDECSVSQCVRSILPPVEADSEAVSSGL